MAGGVGPHNKSPRRGSGLLEGGWGVVFAHWNAPALGGILDQQGVGNVGNSTTYQPSMFQAKNYDTIISPKFVGDLLYFVFSTLEIRTYQ